MHFYFLFFVLMLACAGAEELPIAEPVSFRLEYAGGHIELRDGQPSELTGGVQVWYDEIHLHGDHLTWTQTPIPGAKRSFIDRLDLMAGAAGPTPTHVLLDSTACRMPGVGFRGQFTPASVHLERRAIDPLHPQTLRWRVIMADAGYFYGLMETTSGWVPHAGWASEIEAELIGEVVADRLQNLRFSSIQLFGKTDPDASKRQRARLDRLLKPLAKAEDLADLPYNAAEYGVQSENISMVFDDAGKMIGISPGSNTTMYGQPPSDTPLQLRSRVDPGK